MTTKTGIFTLLAGGICSLTFAGAAIAGPLTKTCENCDKGPGNAQKTTLLSDIIEIELDDEDDSVIIGGSNGAMRQYFGDGKKNTWILGNGQMHTDDEQALTWVVSSDESDLHAPHEPRVMIGVTLGNVSEAMASQLDLDPGGVVMIEDVMEGMPADRAGLRRFDIIISIDGKGNINTPVLQKIIAGKRPGDKALIKILRGGEVRTVEVELALRSDKTDQWRVFDQAERGNLKTERRFVKARRSQEQAERAMKRAQERIERSRHVLQARKERGAMNVEIILKELEEMDIGLDEEVMEQIKAQIRSQLGQPGENFDVQIELPNIEFFEGDGADEAFVLLEGETFSFPGARGKVRIDLEALGANAPTTRMMRKNVFPGVSSSRNPQMNERLDSLEERMERIETLLQRLADRID